MTLHLPSLSSRKGSRHIAATLCAGLLLSLSGCATGSWSRQQASPLPIETHHRGTGTIVSFRAHETAEFLYVTGTAQRHPGARDAHVDILLIGPSGEVLAAAQDDINPSHPRPGGGKRYRDHYVASFPLEHARKAVKIQVIYHQDAHRDGAPAAQTR